MSQPSNYYLPEPSKWPIVGSIALFTIVIGAVNWLHGHSYGPYIFALGMGIMIYMLFGWFGEVIHEDQAGLLESKQMDRSFRWGMFWFIFTEVMFFVAFFGTLFYARVLSVPWLGGEGLGTITHFVLWPHFEQAWPLLHSPDPSQFPSIHGVMDTWGIPALNTLILLTSGVTITWAHWGLLNNKKAHTIIGQLLTIMLGIFFLVMQVIEYGEAYTEKGLTLASGIYGSTFFMLTGFHGLHVTIGTTMLICILYRIIRGHFTAEHHFAFEGVAWYWHFVDVVWLGLFIFVYWL
jgi:cytochrome c oxidase subunit III